MLGGPVSHCFGEECLMLTRKLTKTSVYFDRPDTSLNRTMSPSFVWVVFIFLHYKTWTDRTTSLNWDIFYSVPWVSRLAFSFTVLSIRSDLPVYVSLKQDSELGLCRISQVVGYQTIASGIRTQISVRVPEKMHCGKNWKMFRELRIVHRVLASGVRVAKYPTRQSTALPL